MTKQFIGLDVLVSIIAIIFGVIPFGSYFIQPEAPKAKATPNARKVKTYGMPTPTEVEMYVIDAPSEYSHGLLTVSHLVVSASTILIDHKPVGYGKTLEEARKLVPLGFTSFARDPSPDMVAMIGMHRIVVDHDPTRPFVVDYWMRRDEHMMFIMLRSGSQSSLSKAQRNFVEIVDEIMMFPNPEQRGK
jgi:hypothetical protein